MELIEIPYYVFRLVILAKINQYLLDNGWEILSVERRNTGYNLTCYRKNRISIKVCGATSLHQILLVHPDDTKNILCNVEGYQHTPPGKNPYLLYEGDSVVFLRGKTRRSRRRFLQRLGLI